MTPSISHLLLLILATGTASGVFTPASSLMGLPAFVFNELSRKFSEQQRKCLEGEIECPWRNYISYRGPCSEGEWYIYDKRKVLYALGEIEPDCRPLPCPDNFSLLLPHKKCFNKRDIANTICTGQLHPSYENLFGEVFCSCGYREATLLGSENKQCFTLYTRGPCDEDSIFVPVNDLVNFGFGKCLVSPCAKLLDNDKKKRIAEIRLSSGHTTGCFELGKQGPCKDNYIFDIVDKSAFPAVPHLSCGLGLVASATSSKINNCVEDEGEDCVKPLIEFTPLDADPSHVEYAK